MPAPVPMRILIVDDHELFRDGIASLLATRDFEVVGQASDGAEAVAMTRDLKPEMVIMDVRMPRMGGLEATRLIKAEQPDVRVVMLTVSDDEDDLFEALKAGAQGYLLKKLKSDVFFEFIESAVRGEAPISPSMAAKMLGEFGRESVGEPAAGGVASLSERELEVLGLIARALSNKEIAQKLFITERTVKFHSGNILDKLHLKNRAEVIAYAARKGYGGWDDGSPG